MASGDTLAVFTPLHNEPPASIFATLDTRNSIPVLDFDAATDEEAVFGGFLPNNYAEAALLLPLSGWHRRPRQAIPNGKYL